MAVGQQSFDLASPETGTIWTSMLNIQINNDQPYLLSAKSGLIGEGQNYAFCWDKALQKNDGGKIHKTLLLSLRHQGVPGGSTLRGKEGSFDTAFFEYSVSDYRGGWAFKRPIAEKFVAFNILDNYSMLIGEWCLRRDWYIMLAHLTSYTANPGAEWVDHTNQQIDVAATDVWTRGNPVLTPAPNYIFRGTKANPRATDELVVSGDELDLATIFHVENLIRRPAGKSRHPLRPPMKYQGKPYWLWMIGPKTAETLVNDTEIQSIWSNMLAGGKIDDNPFFNHGIGVIRNFIFYVVDDMPPGVHSSTNDPVGTVERWVIPGANAVSMQYTKGFSPSNRWKYITGTDDGGYEKFMHVYSESGWATTRYTDPLTSELIEFKMVGTSFTGT